MSQIPSAAPQRLRTPELDYYLTLEDGERIAISVWLPPGLAPGERTPVLLHQTRYGRRSANAAKNVALLPAHSYAIAFVEVRGTTVSSGPRLLEINQEAGDMPFVIRHLAAQPWCDGRVVAIGHSYLADTADVATAHGAPSLRGAIVRHAEFDVFTHSLQPGGVQNAWLLREYDRWTLPMDTGHPSPESALPGPTLTPVRGDHDGSLMRQALSGRLRWRAADFAGVSSRDEPSRSGYSLHDWSPARHLAAMRRDAVPVQYWGSWMDSGTAESALARFRSTRQVPVEVWITANDHDGRRLTDPLLPDAVEARPAWSVQQAAMLRFARESLAGIAPRRIIHYYVLGAGEFRTAPAWPPPGIADTLLYLTAARALSPHRPAGATLAHSVDFRASAGTRTRWSANLGIPAEYGDRAALASAMLTFDAPPVQEDMELAGYPLVRLRLASRSRDPAIHVYLDAVAPGGRVSYLTEGMLRLLHRKVVPAARLPFDQGPDRHGYSRADVAPMTPGELADVEIRLLPVAALIRAGHALRISIAGADADTFARYPEAGEEILTLQFGSRASSVTLPLRPYR